MQDIIQDIFRLLRERRRPCRGPCEPPHHTPAGYSVALRRVFREFVLVPMLRPSLGGSSEGVYVLQVQVQAQVIQVQVQAQVIQVQTEAYRYRCRHK